VPDALFVNGNSSNNIIDGSALLNDKAKQITKAVFGKIPKDPKVLDKAVVRLYGKGADGFNVSSCQFALHYFLESPDTLKGIHEKFGGMHQDGWIFHWDCLRWKEDFRYAA
jgi:hypothetical protein